MVSAVKLEHKFHTGGNFHQIIKVSGTDIAVSADNAGGKVFGEVVLHTDTGTITHSLFILAASNILNFHIVVCQTEGTEQIEAVTADRHVTVSIKP